MNERGEMLSLNDHLSIDSIDFCFDNKLLRAINRTKANIVRSHALHCSASLSINNSNWNIFPFAMCAFRWQFVVSLWAKQKTGLLLCLQFDTFTSVCTCSTQCKRRQIMKNEWRKCNTRQAMSVYPNPDEVFGNLFLFSSKRKRIWKENVTPINCSIRCDACIFQKSTQPKRTHVSETKMIDMI